MYIRTRPVPYLCVMIDLRSDTLTIPTEGMRNAMANAVVGDDVYAEDPTIEALQQRVAAMFGKEAGLFVPSGTMGNQICLATQTRAGDEIIADADAHIFHYENAATSVIARAQIYGVKSERGEMLIDDVIQAIRPDAYYYPRTRVIAVELTHNRHGGTAPAMQWIRELSDTARHKGIALHCDGARIWNAMVSLGIDGKTAGMYFDTMSVCLSKGLGAPVGSVILGSKSMIDEARRWRKLLGGGMRQAGVLAAAADVALDEVLPTLPNDHRRALHFAETLEATPGVLVDVTRVQSNIVVFSIPHLNDNVVMSACAKDGLRIAPIKPGLLRAVWYHQISDADTERASAIVASVAARNC